MGRDYQVNRTRHEYNKVETDEERSYNEERTPTADMHPPELGPPEEFGTATPRSRA